MSIGSNLKKIRSTVGISQSELARVADITSVYISNIENDKKSPSAIILAKIASALGVSMDVFFKDKLVSDDEAKEFSSYIKGVALNAPDLDIDFVKTIYEDYKNNESAMLASQYDYRDLVEFITPEEAITFILKQPALAAYGGYDINEMSNEEIIEFANELLNQLKLLGYKYKK